MGIVYRHQKQEPLTIEEMDGNFANLDERVKNLETKPPLAEGIANVAQEGDQLMILGSRGVYSCLVPHTSTDFQQDQGNWALVFEV
ncbi:MAG: hypothetical protein K0R52_834 [Alphaproteobacteria bacterium]|nr:hypothetical protein [Alphaproteobacteria bacterium]